jgi:hypothetical protein
MYELEAAQVKEYIERLDDLRKCLNVDGTKAHIAGIEQEMTAQGFWDDPERAQKTLQKLKASRLRRRCSANSKTPRCWSNWRRNPPTNP